MVVYTLIFCALLLALELALGVALRVIARRSRKFDPGQLVEGRLDEGGQVYAFDEDIGMMPRPNIDLKGKVSLPGKPELQFQTRTDHDGCRQTSDELGGAEGVPVIGTFGCSWTFGTALSDEQTYPWLLQEAMPQSRIKNYGAGGLSTYQMLLRLERALESEMLDTVIVGYLPWHDERNVGRFHRIPWFSAPYVRAQHRLPGSPAEMKRFPHRRALNLKIARSSSVLHSIQYLINWCRGHSADNIEMQKEVAEWLFLRIKKLCESKGTKLLVVSLQHGNVHAEFFEREEFSWIGITPDVMTQDEAGTFRWLLLPYDYHPNEKANRLFSEQIAEALAKLAKGQTVRPSQAFLRQNMRCPITNASEIRNIYTLY